MRTSLYTNLWYPHPIYGLRMPVASNRMERILDFFAVAELVREEARRKRGRPYIYRLDIIQRRLRKRKYHKRFVSLRLVKLFYINVSYHQFRQLASRTRRMYGRFEWNFLLALEARLMSYIYRTSLLCNPFQCMQIIKQGYVGINNKYTPYVNHRVAVGDFVTFTLMAKQLIYVLLIARLVTKRTLFNPPGYMYVSYKFLYSYMKTPPVRKQLVFPISVDLYRATGYAF